MPIVIRYCYKTPTTVTHNHCACNMMLHKPWIQYWEDDIPHKQSQHQPLCVIIVSSLVTLLADNARHVTNCQKMVKHSQKMVKYRV